MFGHTSFLNDNLDRFDWKDKETNVDESRYPGEWFPIDCRLPDITVKVSLWRGEGKAEKEIIPKQHKITELNQIFNITKLTFKDEGNYYCKACNRTDKSVGYRYVNTGNSSKFRQFCPHRITILHQNLPYNLNFRIVLYKYSYTSSLSNSFYKCIIFLDGKAYQTPTILNKTENRVSYGNPFYMDCEVSGWYEMQWYKDNSRQPLQTSVNLGYFTNNHNRITKKRLIIEKFTEVNNGLYTCEVQRQHVGWKSTDHVSLKAKPGTYCFINFRCLDDKCHVIFSFFQIHPTLYSKTCTEEN